MTATLQFGRTRITAEDRQIIASLLKGSNLFEDLRKLAINPPAKSQGLLKHPQSYINAVFEAVTGDKPQSSIQTFLDRFLRMPPAYTSTPAGLCAMAFEAHLIAKLPDLYGKFVETIVQEETNDFLAVFEGSIPPENLDQIEAITNSFVGLTPLVIGGMNSHAVYEVADITILQGVPTTKQPPEVEAPSTNTSVRGYEDASRIYQDAKEGITPHVWRNLHPEAQIDENDTSKIQTYTDMMGITWHGDGEKWIPTALAKPQVNFVEGAKSLHARGYAGRLRMEAGDPVWEAIDEVSDETLAEALGPCVRRGDDGDLAYPIGNVTTLRGQVPENIAAYLQWESGLRVGDVVLLGEALKPTTKRRLEVAGLNRNGLSSAQRSQFAQQVTQARKEGYGVYPNRSVFPQLYKTKGVPPALPPRAGFDDEPNLEFHRRGSTESTQAKITAKTDESLTIEHNGQTQTLQRPGGLLGEGQRYDKRSRQSLTLSFMGQSLHDRANHTTRPTRKERWLRQADQLMTQAAAAWTPNSEIIRRHRRRYGHLTSPDLIGNYLKSQESADEATLTRTVYNLQHPAYQKIAVGEKFSGEDMRKALPHLGWQAHQKLAEIHTRMANTKAANDIIRHHSMEVALHKHIARAHKEAADQLMDERSRSSQAQADHERGFWESTDESETPTHYYDSSLHGLVPLHSVSSADKGRALSATIAADVGTGKGSFKKGAMILLHPSNVVPLDFKGETAQTAYQRDIAPLMRAERKALIKHGLNPDESVNESASHELPLDHPAYAEASVPGVYGGKAHVWAFGAGNELKGAKMLRRSLPDWTPEQHSAASSYHFGMGSDPRVDSSDREKHVNLAYIHGKAKDLGRRLKPYKESILLPADESESYQLPLDHPVYTKLIDKRRILNPHNTAVLANRLKDALPDWTPTHHRQAADYHLQRDADKGAAMQRVIAAHGPIWSEQLNKDRDYLLSTAGQHRAIATLHAHIADHAPKLRISKVPCLFAESILLPVDQQQLNAIHESDSTLALESAFGQWAVEPLGNDAILVRTGSDYYKLSSTISEARKMLESVEASYPNLPAERDLMVEATLKDYVAEHGVQTDTPESLTESQRNRRAIGLKLRAAMLESNSQERLDEAGKDAHDPSRRAWHCPVCHGTNVWNYGDYERLGGDAHQSDRHHRHNAGTVAIAHGSAFDNVCGHCGSNIVRADSPINHPAYTHDDESLNEGTGAYHKLSIPGKKMYAEGQRNFRGLSPAEKKAFNADWHSAHAASAQAHTKKTSALHTTAAHLHSVASKSAPSHALRVYHAHVSRLHKIRAGEIEKLLRMGRKRVSESMDEATEAREVPGIIKWSMTPGATDRTHNYSHRTKYGEYHIFNVGRGRGSSAHYDLQFASTHGHPRHYGGGLWHDLGKHASPQAAASAAAKHHATANGEEPTSLRLKREYGFESQLHAHTDQQGKVIVHEFLGLDKQNRPAFRQKSVYENLSHMRSDPSLAGRSITLHEDQCLANDFFGKPIESTGEYFIATASGWKGADAETLFLNRIDETAATQKGSAVTEAASTSTDALAVPKNRLDEFLTRISNEVSEHWLSFVAPPKALQSPVLFDGRAVGCVEWASDDRGDGTREMYVKVENKPAELIERMLSQGFSRSRRLPDKWRKRRLKDGMKGKSSSSYMKKVRSDESVDEARKDHDVSFLSTWDHYTPADNPAGASTAKGLEKHSTHTRKTEFGSYKIQPFEEWPGMIRHKVTFHQKGSPPQGDVLGRYKSPQHAAAVAAYHHHSQGGEEVPQVIQDQYPNNDLFFRRHVSTDEDKAINGQYDAPDADRETAGIDPSVAILAEPTSSEYQQILTRWREGCPLTNMEMALLNTPPGKHESALEVNTD